MFLWRHPQQILALRMTLVEYLWSPCLQWLLRLRLKGMSMNVEVASVHSLQGLVVRFHPEDFASPEERSLFALKFARRYWAFTVKSVAASRGGVLGRGDRVGSRPRGFSCSKRSQLGSWGTKNLGLQGCCWESSLCRVCKHLLGPKGFW